MRLCLLCLWTSWMLTLHSAAQQHPHREDSPSEHPEHREAVQKWWRRQGTGGPYPPRLDGNKPATVRGPGGGQAGDRRRAVLTGPHVCGGQCCVGWTLSPRTRRCTKPRCFPRCHNGGLCQQSNRCVCRQGFHGSRCEFSTVTFSLPGQPLTSIHPTIIPYQPPVQFSPTHHPPAPTTALKRTTKPAQRHATEDRLSPAAFPSPFVSSRTAAINQEESQASLKSEREKVKTTAEKPLTVNGSKPGIQNWTRDTASKDDGTQMMEKSPNLKSDLGSEDKEGLHSKSKTQPNPATEIQNRVHPGSQSVNLEARTGFETVESSLTEDEKVLHQPGSAVTSASSTGLNPESSLRPEAEKGGALESKSVFKVGDRPNVKTSPRSKPEENEGVLKISDIEFYSASKSESQRRASSNIPDHTPDPGLRGGRTVGRGETKMKEVKRVKAGGAKKQLLSLREAQAVLMRKTLSQGGRGDKMATLLMNHIEKERRKLRAVISSFSSSSNSSSSSTSSSASSSVKSFHTQKGQYTIHITAPTADGQTAVGGGGGGGLERIQVMFTPTICKVRCSQDRCVNYCERGNMTTLYSSNNEGGGGEGGGGRRDGSHGPGFRVFLCPLLCKNGGICLQKDRCLCPPTFTGKFCQIPVAPTSAAAAPAAASPSSTNEIVKPALFPAMAANQELTRSEFLLPLVHSQEAMRSGAPGPSMVKVRVQHPPEASVKIHQVVKVAGYSPTLRTLSSPSSSSSSGSAGAPAPAGRPVQAQTVRGDGTYTQYSGFKYCFREVKDGQCSSPLPGLRSRETCCKGIGKGWGITDCVLCPDNIADNNSSCPSGFERANGTQCVDVNECLQPGLCENGICVNTRGSYSCVCRAGFILDASHGICISQSVISDKKGQCYRVLGYGQGPASCSLPILRNITKQICCCSRVGKAWGPDCQRCPYFGSVAFKEICPAGPGYHYSASALQFNQRVNQQLGGGGATLVPHSSQENQGPGSGSRSSGATRSQQKPSSSGETAGGASTSVGSSAGSAGTSSVQTRPSPPQPQPRPPPQPPSHPQTHPAAGSPATRPVHPGATSTTGTQDKPQTRTPAESAPSLTTQPRPQSPVSTGSQAGSRPSTVSRPQPPARGDTLPAPAQPHSLEHGSRPAVTPTSRPTRVQTVRGVCESRPGMCGHGRCVDEPGGKHSCVCDQGYQLNSQRTHCQDVNECVQSPGVCPVGECLNTMGSYRCVCPSGYRGNSQQTGCQDIDECQLTPCRNGRCVNMPGSYRCVCHLGYRLTGNICTDVDECEDPLLCPGQECVNSQGSYRCTSCQPGFGLLNRLCTDIDECRQAPCSNGHCENTPGSYRCVCHHGYKLQNNNCTDVDECAEPSQCPGQMCVNSVGSYRCVSCQPGFTLTNRKCTDVDECESSDTCSGQQCVNTEGSYSCVDCQRGYHSVNGVCTDVDECEQISQCPRQQCVNTEGSYRCVSCQPGYSMTDGSCQDVDECASASACEAERVCVNTVGSFRCDCPPGYRTSGLGRQCRDINECLESDFCFSGGECVNTPGTYTCVCSQGYTLSANRTSCLDVDECVKPGVCLDGRCVNTEGSFQCQCQSGFTTNPEKNTCLDVDECVMSAGSICGSQRCENTIGSYHCLTSCEPGYQVTQTGKCVDVNECTNKTVCGDHAFCQNLIGTYLCVCDMGFTTTADGKACVDEDECVSLEDACGSARCENMEGSFMCVCEGLDEFDVATRKCVSPAQPAAAGPNYSSSPSSPSSSSFSSPSFPVTSMAPLPAARPGEQRECYYNLADQGTCSLLATNTSQQECCCTVGEAWGLGCQYHACPLPDTAEFLSLCPSGRGYVTTGPGAFSYSDVDECKRFLEVCKNGVCVNNIPGYSCYCTSGYVYNSTLLECVDHDECEEESCVGGVCVNTVGSYYCSCQPPLVLDDTQRNCVNSSHLTVDENLSVCWQHVSADLMCQTPLLGAQVTFTDCCCLYGEGWGMECALCPSTDSDDYAFLCSSFLSPLFPTYPDSGGPETGGRPGTGTGGGGGAPPRFPPYSVDSFSPAGRDFSQPDYDDYSPAGGSRSGFRGRTPASFSLPDGAFRRPEFSTGYYSEGDYGSPDASQPRTPSFRLPPDPRAETAFGARPPPPSRPDGPPLSLAPLPGAPYEEQEEEEEEPWRPGPPFPPFTERGRGGGAGLRRVYERRYESYAGLSAAEDCGILNGCENGRCIRVAEGYTCDCYQGYELDMASMTCIDVNECEDSVSMEYPCVNARCVNTEGSFRCVCRRGYIMSRRPNHCVAA